MYIWVVLYLWMSDIQYNQCLDNVVRIQLILGLCTELTDFSSVRCCCCRRRHRHCFGSFFLYRFCWPNTQKLSIAELKANIKRLSPHDMQMQFSSINKDDFQCEYSMHEFYHAQVKYRFCDQTVTPIAIKRMFG